ncbi:MAG: histidine phosphatase family protein [Candidatus Liptonbacteria bacterium]|nr:histidine phosphatase family protein [Candidatus Liptonbacteria bacterium]
MKWPASITFMRHDVSSYNALKESRRRDPDYVRFEALYEKPELSATESRELETLARLMHERHSLHRSDADTSLVDCQSPTAAKVGQKLKNLIKLPDAIFVSPYKRTRHTFAGLVRGWPKLGDVKAYEDERLREQEHGLAILYNDWRVFNVLHPRQREFHELEGSYWYRYPQGENVPDVRERTRSWMTTIVRDWAGKHVLVVTHHLCILAIRANFERWGARKFQEVDEKEKPINCGITIYQGHPELGRNGKLVLKAYNLKLY